jgi:hypothetical protein
MKNKRMTQNSDSREQGIPSTMNPIVPKMILLLYRADVRFLEASVG